MPKTNIEGMAALIEKAKEDPKFFHDLVWNTERSLGSLDFLTREEKAAVLEIDPEDLIVGLATGDFRNLGANCGSSCGGSCKTTCASTCAHSGSSDGHLTVSTPVNVERENLTNDINREISNMRFSRFSRNG